MESMLSLNHGRVQKDKSPRFLDLYVKQWLSRHKSTQSRKYNRVNYIPFMTRVRKIAKTDY